MTGQERRTMQGMRYRQSPAETLSGCRHLRCKAFLVIALGVLLVASFPATLASALLIVGVFLILLGFALAFMYYVARDVGKTNTTAGQGVNRSWNRIRRQRLERRRRRNASSSTRRSVNPNPASEEHDAPPPAYETSISVEELMRCPEPTDWTFLPTEPPPVYFPPITALDSNQSSDNPSRTDQSELPVYSISNREMSFTLPTYEQAIDDTPTQIAVSENATHTNLQNTVVVEMNADSQNETTNTPAVICETSNNISHSNTSNMQHSPSTVAQTVSESANSITQVII